MNSEYITVNVGRSCGKSECMLDGFGGTHRYPRIRGRTHSAIIVDDLGIIINEELTKRIELNLKGGYLYGNETSTNS